MYDTTVNTKNQEEVLLKKRDQNDFIEKVVNIDKAYLNKLALPIKFHFEIDLKKESNSIGTKMIDESFKPILKSIISKFHDSQFEFQFIELAKLMLKADKGSFEFMVEAVVSSIQTVPKNLLAVNELIKSIYKNQPKDFEFVLETVLGKLENLQLENLYDEFSKTWEEFTFVI